MLYTQPFLIRPGTTAKAGARLKRSHSEFNEHFLQELLVEHPHLLPVAALRHDVGDLICIGREVPTRDSGSIDNLYLSTAGYLVVVETKLWRNPQSRREVVSQVLDYVKDVVTRDFDWLSSVWSSFCAERGRPRVTLLDALREAIGEDFDEGEFVDRLHRGMSRGHVIALIVGDGIESRLQELVAHLCRDTAHLRYSLGLVSLRCYQMPDHEELLILPELVQQVEPVERAYVRIEIAEALEDRVSISSVTTEETSPASATPRKRTLLTEETFFDSLKAAVGSEVSEHIRHFIEEVAELGVVPEYKASAVMLKTADPADDNLPASLLAFEKSGRVYNPDHGGGQIRRWGWDEAAVARTIGAYWAALHKIDHRFLSIGIGHMNPKDFLPLSEVLPKLDQIREAMGQAVAAIQREYEG